MEKLLLDISERQIATNGNKIKQNVRNELKREIMQELFTTFKNSINNELIKIEMVQNGVGFSIDNANVGFISFELDIKIKDLDYDLDFESENYQYELQEKEQIKREKEKLKADKIKNDIEKRKQKAELKEKLKTEMETE